MSTQPFERRETEARMRVLKDTYIYGQPVDGAPSWVRTWPDLNLLARAHGLPLRSVAYRAKHGDWAAARARAKAQVEVAGERARAEQRIRTSMLAEVDALVSVEKGLHLVRDRLESMDVATSEWHTNRDRYQVAVETGDTETLDELATWVPYHPADVRDLKGLADAGRGYVEMLQTTLGSTTMNVVVSGDVQVDHIHRTLSQDDPMRLHALLEAISRAQIAPMVEGEIIEDDDEEIEP